MQGPLFAGCETGNRDHVTEVDPDSALGREWRRQYNANGGSRPVLSTRLCPKCIAEADRKARQPINPVYRG